MNTQSIALDASLHAKHRQEPRQQLEANALTSLHLKEPSAGNEATNKGVDEAVLDAPEASTTRRHSTLFASEFKTPYLTCSRCNNVTFINVTRVRPRDAPRDPDTLHQYEQLPVCSGCGTTKYLRAGVVSFQDKIADEQRAIKEFERKRGPATSTIQRIARGCLARLELRRRKLARERYLRMIHVSATRIQARVRGMQARRRTIIERCLCIIRGMHASILKHALAPQPDRPPVFWYDNPFELQVLFWNYREFVRRSGGKPPLIKVEKNLIEIARMMLRREYELASRIQSRWRGLTTRIVYLEFKRQRGWLRGLWQSPAIKIQRLFRAHLAKKRCSALRTVSQYPGRLAAYQAHRQAKERTVQAQAFRTRLLAKYRLGYQTGKTTKMLVLEPTATAVSSTLSVSSSPRRKVTNMHEHLQHSLKTDDRTGIYSSPSPAPSARSTAGADMSVTTPGRLPVSARSGPDGGSGEMPRNPVGSSYERNNLGNDQPVPMQSRHPNSRKLAEMQRLRMARMRGPRLHILHAQRYAPSDAAEDDPDERISTP